MESSKLSSYTKLSNDEYFNIKDDGIIADGEYMSIKDLMKLGIVGDIKLEHIYKLDSYFSCSILIGNNRIFVKYNIDRNNININNPSITITANEDTIYNSVNMQQIGTDFIFSFEGESINIIKLNGCCSLFITVVVEHIENYLWFHLIREDEASASASSSDELDDD
jgi:hypothetical protein